MSHSSTYQVLFDQVSSSKFLFVVSEMLHLRAWTFHGDASASEDAMDDEIEGNVVDMMTDPTDDLPWSLPFSLWNGSEKRFRSVHFCLLLLFVSLCDLGYECDVSCFTISVAGASE